MFQGQNFRIKVYLHHPFYYCQNEFFAEQKSLRVLKLLRVLNDKVFWFHSDRILFRFLSDAVLLRVLSDRTLFESSVTGSFSGSSVVESSLRSSVLFFRHGAVFLIETCYSFFYYSKQIFCLALYFQTKFLLNN